MGMSSAVLHISYINVLLCKVIGVNTHDVCQMALPDFILGNFLRHELLWQKKEHTLRNSLCIHMT